MGIAAHYFQCLASEFQFHQYAMYIEDTFNKVTVLNFLHICVVVKCNQKCNLCIVSYLDVCLSVMTAQLLAIVQLLHLKKNLTLMFI